MRVVILPSPDDVAEFAANVVTAVVNTKAKANKSCVLGLATGGTPMGLYRQLVDRYTRREISFRGVTTFNLDEYVGVPPEHVQSYHYYMQDALFKHVDFDSNANHIPKTWNCDLTESAQAYERAIKEHGGIDLQILGIGTDGHIGFNEVGSSLGSRTRLKTLTRRTRLDNARFFSIAEEVPRMALTMGIATILESRAILLMATGISKASAIAGCVEGPVSSNNPSSALQLNPNVTIVLDEEAASLLKHHEYYRDSESVLHSLSVNSMKIECS
ncbi:MAG: glucosamine-6-phosphate deaminase [Pirellula sp.]|nr:glucosamine-6-phosphate deaminase [Pirellula sp.]